MEELLSNNETMNLILAVLGVIIAFFAFLTSIISLVVSVRALNIQRRHNVLSVVPIPLISLHDYENSLSVLLRNNGSGPLIIRTFIAKRNGEEKSSVIDWMNTLPNKRNWTDFIEEIDGRTILPGNYLTLLELTSEKNETGFGDARDLTRGNLKDLECLLDYTDVYQTEFTQYRRKLDWFKRNLPH